MSGKEYIETLEAMAKEDGLTDEARRLIDEEIEGLNQ